MTSDKTKQIPFTSLGLSAAVLKVLDQVGYETPSPIQAAIIPHILAGRDVVGQAQTGTGKTAAFALPLLTKINLKQKTPQVLVLTPTRELAIQVAEAFQRYASNLKGFHVLPIYGGQEYRIQLKPLKRGVHVVVGTPGRVMDHIRRGTLVLDDLDALVLDEADEMLRMGFIDDVEWVLEKTPQDRQIALFSATMPDVIRRIANRHLQDPEHITIKQKTTTAANTRQRYWVATGVHKLDALTRILEAEKFDGIIIFTRTKIATIELAEKLNARGYAATAINGEIPQAKREKTIDQFKKGKLDILVATDVVARGLDVDRVSHVINYDIPYDTEAYIHRIGRTGRAGRSGEAIMFVAPREKRLLHAIEKATRQKIELMELPSTDVINNQRIARFKQEITDTLTGQDLDLFREIIEQYRSEHDTATIDIAAALAKLAQGKEPLLLKDRPAKRQHEERTRQGKQKRPSTDRPQREQNRDKGTREHRKPEEGMETYRLEVGHTHGVKPANIVGAIANEAGLESEYIGRISIFDDHSTIDLPEGMPKDIFKDLQKTWVSGQQLRISRLGEKQKVSSRKRPKTAAKKKRTDPRKKRR